jgi:putative transport protein
MQWFLELLRESSAAHALLVLSVVVAAGLALGRVRILGASLGVGGVLFTGLLAARLGWTLDADVLGFLRDFGLILFVYAMGLQVGPGFFASFRRQGLLFNLLSGAIILGGTLLAVAFALGLHIDVATGVGLLAGAVTNTPSLGAAQQAVKDLGKPEIVDLVGLGYAVTYPFGTIGTLLVLAGLVRFFRIDPRAEAREFERRQTRGAGPVLMRNYEVTNPNLAGMSVDGLLDLVGPGVVISRLYREGRQVLAHGELSIAVGDVLHAVGTEERLDRFKIVVGRESSLELPDLPSAIHIRRVVVTRPECVGRTLDELALEDHYGIVVTRILRAGTEFTPTHGLHLAFGDRLVLVGIEAALDRATPVLGDRVQELDRPNVIPIFVGILLGVLLGSIPIALPGLPAPVRLGLAGGPLIVAILLGRFGRIGPFLAHMPNAGKNLLREFGLALFLACVGMLSGRRFFEVLSAGSGLLFLGLGCVISLLPPALVGIYARAVRKLDFVSLSGILAGATSNVAALSYATEASESDAPSLAYATVYPLTVLLRVLLAQVVVILLSR